MKVTLTKKTMENIKASQLDPAKEVVRACREDESSAAEYATYAVNCILHDTYESCASILQCSAEVMPNCRVWGLWGNETENLDVWIEGIADCYDSFVRFGAYLSDIWSINGDNCAELARHMYKRVYTEAKN